MVGSPVTRLTEEQYLARERAAEYKSEFDNGMIVDMSGASPNHVRIMSDLTVALGSRLEGKSCDFYTADLRVKITRKAIYRYPDIVLVCGPLQYADDRQDTITNPSVIIEILSPSTEGYDRGRKFEQYREIPTLREYILVSVDRPLVERFQREDGGLWRVEYSKGLEAELTLDTAGITVPLRAMYRRVEFTEGEE